MQDNIVLTVSESKRLIAKAVASLPQVKKAKGKGILVVSTGSTNAYVAEEILQNKIEKRGFLTGYFKPAKKDSSDNKPIEKLSDLIFKNGKEIKDKSKTEMLMEMCSEDVFIKGANALNYDKKIAGVTIGHPKGGTIGDAMGTVTSKKIQLIIPAGLEKLVAHDILETWRRLNEENEHAKGVYGLFPVFGKIITEIEAVKILFDVEAVHAGSGGIFGAEGAVMLLLCGEKENIKKAKIFLEEIQGEPAF